MAHSLPHSFIQEDRTITVAVQRPAQAVAKEDRSALEIFGGHSLQGQVTISGAKNSALVIMAGTLLCADDCRITNVPKLADINNMAEILKALGVSLKHDGNTLEINASDIGGSEAPYELVSRLRASFFAIGPLLSRLGEVKIPLPGGCAIGARPVELHVKGLQAMGASVQIEHGIVKAAVIGGGRLKGAKIYLDCPSVGATETLMMAATLADGETIIENAAQEPEVEDLANFCCALGAKIEGAGTNTIVISGVEKLHGGEWDIIPDRIEAGTFLVAGAITRSELTLNSVVPDHLTAVIAKLHSVGCKVITESDSILRIIPAETYKATDIKTMPFPGFPTDMQAQFMALLTLAEGNSVITEMMFENRLQHVAELQRMGANIKSKGNMAIVGGMPFLSGAPVMATDLRASAALVLAGLAAQGKTTVQQLRHLDRGYEQLDEKLRRLGAKIERIEMSAS